MFAAVMSEPENAKGVLERILGVQISQVDVETEKTFLYNPEYKGVRLDVYLEDEYNTRFNVEMQLSNDHLKKRARYYHSQIDMDILASGGNYRDLPDTYVIFICDYDPFGLKKYKYTVRKSLQEQDDFDYDDGIKTIFLSTKGINTAEVGEDLVSFLHFVSGEYEQSGSLPDDALVQQLHQSVERIRYDREKGAQYMLMDILMQDQFEAGKAEGLAEGKAEGLAEGELNSTRSIIIGLLKESNLLTDALTDSINCISDIDALRTLVKVAAKATTEVEFRHALEQTTTNQ